MLDDTEKITHDIKSTIMSIKAYVQLVMRKTNVVLDKKTFDYIVRLDKQVDKLIKQIQKVEITKSTKSSKTGK